MTSILEAFAKDELLSGPRFFQSNTEYGEEMEKLCATEEKLLELLTEEGKTLLDEYSQIRTQLNTLHATERFTYGYRLGVLMITEVFTTREDLLINSEA